MGLTKEAGSYEVLLSQTYYQEDNMERPDMDTLACVNEECQLFDQPGAGNLTLRKVYGQDQLRLLRCNQCQEEFSERRGTALFNTKIPEAKAEAVISHLDEGCTLTGTARLVKVAKDTVSRLLKVAGRHAEKFHDQNVQGIAPQALEFDEQSAHSMRSSTSSLVNEGNMRLGTLGGSTYCIGLSYG